MQVKVFESDDMASGLKMVKDKLGPDALILSTRTIKKGRLGLLGKTITEITAAVDSPWPRQKETIAAGNPIFRFPHKTEPDPDPDPNPGTYNSSLTMNIDREVTQDKVKEETRQQAETDNSPAMTEEFDQLKEMVKNLATQVGQINSSPLPTTTPVGNTAIASLTTPGALPADNPVISLLIEQGINQETAETIAGYVTDKQETLVDQKLSIEDFIRTTIGELLQTKAPAFEESESQYRLALVGPTGVGKTTTLAKIAASFLSRFSNSIALITIDTYRIAAVEQLKVYGEIMQLPVEVVITPEQLDEALLRHRDKQLVLIDTAGRSPKDSLCIDELTTFLRPDLNIDKHLVISASTREDELLDIINRFSRLGIDRTIISKTDECTRLGSILNLQIQSSIPLSYITTGQRVPEDLFEATGDAVAQLIIPPHEGNMNE